MKKVLSIVAALLLCVGTQAQIVSSRSSIVRTEKQQSNKQWFLRGGLNVMKMTGDDVVANLVTTSYMAFRNRWEA